MTEYADLIPLRRVETTADRMRHATAEHHAAVEDRLHVTLNDLANAQRAVRELTVERDFARTEARNIYSTLKVIEQERDEALDELTKAWAALNAAGMTGLGSVAELIGRLAAERDALAKQVPDAATPDA